MAVDEMAIIEELLRKKHIRHYSPYGQLKEITTKILNEIPVFNCPICNNNNVPLIYKATMEKGDKTVDIYECACCGKVPNFAHDIKIEATIKL